ncbi:MAG: hypothetical protein KDD51_02240 [Bdellovibrionales bacterium]|nr:hypothetical protein [Bdellovibrionales bacterium]
MTKSFFFVVMAAFLMVSAAQAKSPRVPNWMLLAVELSEHPVEIPDFESLKLSTGLRQDGEDKWLDFSFIGSALSLPEGYKVIASWSSSAAFDGHSLRLRRTLKPIELKALEYGKLELSIRALDHGYFRFEFWSPRGIQIHLSETRSF